MCLYLVQNIVRASVTQGNQATQVKSNVGALEIKLPQQSNENKAEIHSPSSPHQTEGGYEVEDGNDDEDEDEDDWDTFQSFPAASNATNVDTELNAEIPSMLENDGIQEIRCSIPSNDVNETVSEVENGEEETLQGSPHNHNVHELEGGDLALEACETQESHNLSNVSEIASSQDDNNASSHSHQPINSPPEDDTFQEVSRSLTSNDVKEINSERQSEEEEVPQQPPQRYVHESETTYLTSEASESCEFLVSASGAESIQDDYLTSSYSQQPSNNENETDESNVVMNNLISKESPGDLMNQEAPADTLSVGDYPSSALQTPDLEDNKLHCDQSAESAGNSVLVGSPDNEISMATEAEPKQP